MYSFKQITYFGAKNNCNKWCASLKSFLMFFVLMSIGFTTALAQTPTSPADCRSGCTSNDVQILKAYLSNSAGVQLSSNFVCPASGVATVYLTLELTTNTPRVGVVVYAKVKNFTAPSTIGSEIATIKECFGIMLNQPTNKVTFQQPFNWTCGNPIVLTDVFLGWGTGNTNFCAGSSAFRCNSTPSKCFNLPPGQYIAIVTPNPGTASGSACSLETNSFSAFFNLNDYEAAIKDGQNVTVTWFANYSNPTFSNQIADPANFHATAATTIVYAKVCSMIDVNVCSAATCTLTVNPLPLSLAPAITQTNCVTATGTVNVVSPVSGVTYTLKQGGVLKYTANGSGVFSAVIPGTYSLNASNGTCSSTGAEPVTVNVQPVTPAAPTICVVQPSLCGPTTGSVTILTPTGSGYEFSIDNGANWQTSNAFNNLAPGSVTGVLVKKDGCVSTAANCDASSCAATRISETEAAPEAKPVEKVLNMNFEAFPVPFKDILTVKYKFDYKSDVKIEVFNAQGIRVFSKTDTNVYFNKEVALDLAVKIEPEQVYVIKLTTNKGTNMKKIISSGR